MTEGTWNAEIVYSGLDTPEGVIELINGLVGSVLALCHQDKTANQCLVMEFLARQAIHQMVMNGHSQCAKQALVSMLLQYAEKIETLGEEDAGVIIEKKDLH